MNLTPSFAVSDPLKLPVRVIEVDGFPKIISGAGPVTPFNIALKRLREREGITPCGLGPYVRSARLYSEFCAHQRSSIIDISDADFYRFEDALLCKPFTNVDGEWVSMKGKKVRIARTADLMLSTIYSLAAKIEVEYDVTFDWRRYGNMPREISEIIRASQGGHHISFPRTHHIRWNPRKIIGLPDEQFVKLLEGARELWVDLITEGDLVFADNPEQKRGALYYRNTAILLILRYAGSRRREVTFVRFCDIHRSELKLYLITKGHGGEFGKRLPVTLFPFVEEAIRNYGMKFRPTPEVGSKEAWERVFLSHSARNYGQPITDQTVRKIVERVRAFLDPPWNQTLTPHMLGHAFGYQLQRVAGLSAQTANMRHASPASGKAYSAGVENFIDELAKEINAEFEYHLSRTPLLKMFAKGGR